MLEGNWCIVYLEEGSSETLPTACTVTAGYQGYLLNLAWQRLSLNQPRPHHTQGPQLAIMIFSLHLEKVGTYSKVYKSVS